MPLDEARSRINSPPKYFEIESDLLGTKKTGRDYWIPLEAVQGTFKTGDRSTNLYAKPISQVCFKIDKSIIGSTAWSDFSIWVFNAKIDGTLEIPFNRHLKTSAGKEHRHVMMNARHEINLLMLCVPFANADIKNCTHVLKYNRALGCIHNYAEPKEIPPTVIGFEPYDLQELFGLKALLPSLRLSGPDSITADAKADYAIELYSKNTDALVDDVTVRVYLEANAGYLPYRQVEIKNGIATFPFCAFGLSPGDRVKLKVGWRHYSGADEKIITII
jgi:hypothetical protein